VDALVSTVKWAVDTYRLEPDRFRAMQRRVMGKRFGWDVAARTYADVYAWAVAARRGEKV
jgi:starch synthase